jgi:hypothetical protein
MPAHKAPRRATVLLNIASYLEDADLCQFSLTSKHISAIAQDALFQPLSVSIDQKSVFQLQSNIARLAKQSCRGPVSHAKCGNCSFSREIAMSTSIAASTRYREVCCLHTSAGARHSWRKSKWWATYRVRSAISNHSVLICSAKR